MQKLHKRLTLTSILAGRKGRNPLGELVGN